MQRLRLSLSVSLSLSEAFSKASLINWLHRIPSKAFPPLQCPLLQQQRCRNHKHRRSCSYNCCIVAIAMTFQLAGFCFDFSLQMLLICHLQMFMYVCVCVCKWYSPVCLCVWVLLWLLLIADCVCNVSAIKITYLSLTQITFKLHSFPRLFCSCECRCEVTCCCSFIFPNSWLGILYTLNYEHLGVCTHKIFICLRNFGRYCVLEIFSYAVVFVKVRN